MTNLDRAIRLHRQKADVYQDAKLALDVAQQNFFKAQREYMFARDDLREAERNDREAPTKLILKTI